MIGAAGRRRVMAAALTLALVAAACASTGGANEDATETAPATAAEQATLPEEAPMVDRPDTEPAQPAEGDADPGAASGAVAPILPAHEMQAAVTALTPPIADCVARTDTDWPVFHGCYDWHSAVHGVFALHAAATLTSDADHRTSLLAAADDALEAEAVAVEAALIADGSLDRLELPYGFAWLLWADVARDEAGGGDDLRLAATNAADRLVDYLEDQGDGRYLSDRYPSSTWAAISLLRWARHLGLADHADAAVSLGAPLVTTVRQQEACAVPAQQEFFSPCHLSAFLAVELGVDLDESVIERFHTEAPLSPEETTSDHAAGLNFSRTWGLARVAAARCDDHAVRDRIRDHITTHLGNPELWREGYRAHSHWIPQFGVLALQLIAEADAACGAS